MQLQNPQKKSRPFQVCLHSFHICFHMCPSRTKLFPSHFHKKLLLACERTNKHEERYYFAWHNIVSGDLTKWTFLFFLEPLCLVFFKKIKKEIFSPLRILLGPRAAVFLFLFCLALVLCVFLFSRLSLLLLDHPTNQLLLFSPFVFPSSSSNVLILKRWWAPANILFRSLSFSRCILIKETVGVTLFLLGFASKIIRAVVIAVLLLRTLPKYWLFFKKIKEINKSN